MIASVQHSGWEYGFLGGFPHGVFLTELKKQMPAFDGNHLMRRSSSHLCKHFCILFEFELLNQYLSGGGQDDHHSGSATVMSPPPSLYSEHCFLNAFM